MTERKAPQEPVTVCAYSCCTAAEVVALVQYAERHLATAVASARETPSAINERLLETAHTLLWWEEEYDD